MKIKDLEKIITDYLEDKTIYERRKKALRELDKVQEKFSPDDIEQTLFIVYSYPKYDHLLLKLDSQECFIKFGIRREYLEGLSKKGIHKLAKALHSLYGHFNLYKGAENE